MELTSLLPIAIAFIMFSLGLNLNISDFARVFTQPKDILIGLLSQIIILPLVAFCIIIFIFPNKPSGGNPYPITSFAVLITP